MGIVARLIEFYFVKNCLNLSNNYEESLIQQRAEGNGLVPSAPKMTCCTTNVVLRIESSKNYFRLHVVQTIRRLQ